MEDKWKLLKSRKQLRRNISIENVNETNIIFKIPFSENLQNSILSQNKKFDYASVTQNCLPAISTCSPSAFLNHSDFQLAVFILIPLTQLFFQGVMELHSGPAILLCDVLQTSVFDSRNLSFFPLTSLILTSETLTLISFEILEPQSSSRSQPSHSYII